MKKIPSRLQQHITTFIGTLTTIGLTLISDFFLGLPKEITWLTFFIGAIVTVTVTMLEQRLLSAYADELNSKLKILTLIDQIEDQELRKLAEISVENCVRDIEGFQRGFIPISVYHHQRNKVLESRNSYHTVTWVDSPQGFIAHAGRATWRSYYDITIEVAKSGVKVEQVFVMPKKDIINADNNLQNTEIFEILKKYQDDGISVRVSWIDEWKGRSDVTDLYQSFGIIDSTIVIAPVLGISNKRIGTMLIKQPGRVQEYEQIYKRFIQPSRPLKEVLREYLPTTNSQPSDL